MAAAAIFKYLKSRDISTTVWPSYRKNVKSPYICDCLTDFDEIWCDYAYWPLAADQLLKFWIFEIQDGSDCRLEKSQKSWFPRNGLTDLYDIWYADTKWVS